MVLSGFTFYLLSCLGLYYGARAGSSETKRGKSGVKKKTGVFKDFFGENLLLF